jgi:RNA-directed DNA polymerase
MTEKDKKTAIHYKLVGELLCDTQSKDSNAELSGLVRTRLRICQWKIWKKPATRVKRLLKLGASKQKAYAWGNSSKSHCRIAHSPVLCTTINNQNFRKQDYYGFYNTYNGKTEAQPSLF